MRLAVGWTFLLWAVFECGQFVSSKGFTSKFNVRGPDAIRSDARRRSSRVPCSQASAAQNVVSQRELYGSKATMQTAAHAIGVSEGLNDRLQKMCALEKLHRRGQIKTTNGRLFKVTMGPKYILYNQIHRFHHDEEEGTRTQAFLSHPEYVRRSLEQFLASESMRMLRQPQWNPRKQDTAPSTKVDAARQEEQSLQRQLTPFRRLSLYELMTNKGLSRQTSKDAALLHTVLPMVIRQQTAKYMDALDLCWRYSKENNRLWAAHSRAWDRVQRYNANMDLGMVWNPERRRSDIEQLSQRLQQMQNAAHWDVSLHSRKYDWKKIVKASQEARQIWKLLYRIRIMGRDFDGLVREWEGKGKLGEQLKMRFFASYQSSPSSDDGWD